MFNKISTSIFNKINTSRFNRINTAKFNGISAFAHLLIIINLTNKKNRAYGELSVLCVDE